LTRFANGNAAAQKPQWSRAEIKSFQRDLAAFRRGLNYTHADLSRALDYSCAYVRMMQGHYNTTRQPSQEFLRRFAALRNSAPKPKPAFLAALAFTPDVDAIPVCRILGAIKQCPECLHEFRRGARAEPDTWWVMRVPRQIYHSRDHRAAAALRRRRRRHLKHT